MTSYLWILLSAAFVISRAQDGFSLEDALGEEDHPATPKPAPPKKNDDLDLGDALGPDTPSEPKKPSGDPSKSGGDFNILDAFDDSKKPVDPKKPAKSGGGNGFSDSDLNDVAGNDHYQPDAGRGGRAGGDSYDTKAGEGQPTAAEGGQMAGIISAVAVAIFGAASSYFAYQKKKLCFKGQGGGDMESGRNQSGTQSEPQILSNLLRIS